MRDLARVERPNDVALFLDDSFGKIAAQKLSDVDSDGIAVLQRRTRAHDRVAHHDRPIRFDHLNFADTFVVIAKNLQQHVAARARRKQNVVSFEQARIIGNEVLGFRGFELEPAAHRARAAPQIYQIHLAVVVKNDPVFERSFNLRPSAQFNFVEDRIDVAQRFYAYFQAKRDFQRTFARTRTLQSHFIRVPVYPDENLRQRDILLRVEILLQLLISQHMVANQNPLARINPAKAPAHQWPAADRHVLTAVILQQNQFVIAKREQAFVFRKTLQFHVASCVVGKRKRFER